MRRGGQPEGMPVYFVFDSDVSSEGRSLIGAARHAEGRRSATSAVGREDRIRTDHVDGAAPRVPRGVPAWSRGHHPKLRDAEYKSGRRRAGSKPSDPAAGVRHRRVHGS